MKTGRTDSGKGQPWVKETLVIKPLEAESDTEAIVRLGAHLVVGGFVKDSWLSAAIEREKHFPTGLPTAEIGVAIPHADVEHVLAPAIAVGVLTQPVLFGEMGNPEGTVPVQIVCALAVARSELMVQLLQQLVEMFQNPLVLHQIVEAQDAEDVAQIFNRNIQIEEEIIK